MDPLDEYPAMMSPHQAGAYLGVSVETLKGWRKRGGGPPYVKLGEGQSAAVRYPREDLRRYTEDNTVRPAAAS